MKPTNIEDGQRSSNICIIGVPEKENWSQGAEQILKSIIKKIFLELKKNWKCILKRHIFNINQQQDTFQ